MKAKHGFRTKFYPNGEFTCGYVPPNRFEETYDDPAYEGLPRHLAPIDIYHVAQEVASSSAEMERDTIGLSIPANYHSRRGLSGITSRGQRFIRNAAHLLESDVGKRNLTFLTLTVPSVSVEESKAIARNWSEIIRVFCQRLKRKLQKEGLAGVYIGVTEVQTKRWLAYGTVGLHLHILFQGRSKTKKQWVIEPRWARAAWLSLLEPYRDAHPEDRAVENLQQVRKSAGSYLGKYMSKGCAIVDEIVAEHGEDVIPTSWYTATVGLKQRVASSIVVRWSEEYNLRDRLPYLCATSVIKHVGVITITIDGQEFVVGYSGRIDLEKAKIFEPELSEIIDLSNTSSSCRQGVLPGLENLA